MCALRSSQSRSGECLSACPAGEHHLLHTGDVICPPSHLWPRLLRPQAPFSLLIFTEEPKTSTMSIKPFPAVFFPACRWVSVHWGCSQQGTAVPQLLHRTSPVLPGCSALQGTVLQVPGLYPCAGHEKYKYALGPAPCALLAKAVSYYCDRHNSLKGYEVSSVGEVALFQKKIHIEQFDNGDCFLQAEISSNWQNLVSLSDFFFSLCLCIRAHLFLSD